MIEKLSKYIPENAVHLVDEILKNHPIDIKIVNNRTTKHGDFKRTKSGTFQITIKTDYHGVRFSSNPSSCGRSIHMLAH